VRYASWVENVFAAFVTAADQNYDFGLAKVGDVLGIAGLDTEAFARHEPVGDALMMAAHDLEALGLVEFTNIAHGNKVTASGRDVAVEGLRSLGPAISGLTLRPDEQAVLARIYEACRIEDAAWASLGSADTDAIAADLWPDLSAYDRQMRMMTVIGDLKGKGLTTRALSGPSIQSQRPTYVGVVRISEPDARDDGIEAGLIDWGAPTPGFEAVADRLAELKTRLAAARSPDDLSDIGRRCRAIASDAVDAVFRPEMVPSGATPPSPQDTKRRLELYIEARVGGGEMAEYRDFLRSSLKLANARTHSTRTGYVAAVVSAQGLLSFVRALEAVERSRLDDEAGP